MFTLEKTETFIKWYHNLRDDVGKRKIYARLLRVELGNLGDVRPVGDGVSEMRIDFGPGYRLYYVQKESVIILLLCGGDKDSQQRDIEKAKQIWKELQNEN